MMSFDRILGVIGEIQEKVVLPKEALELLKKREKARKLKDWKTADAIRIQLQAFDITGRGEREVMFELIKIVSGDSLRLDAGFNSRDLTRAIGELFMVPYIYPKKINKLNGDSIWKNMYLGFFFEIYDWLKEYHQRSHTESFHSAFKRVYGQVSKINYTARFVQVTARIILHNFRRLSYFARCN